MIAWMLGADKTGEYAPSYDLAQQSLGMIMFAVFLAGFPHLAKYYDENDGELVHSKFSEYLLIIYMLLLPAFAGIVLLAPNISQSLLGDRFQAGAAEIVVLISVATVFSSFKYYYIDLSFQLTKYTKGLIPIAVLVSIINIILNYYWIPLFGIMGAAYSTVLSFFLSAIISWKIGVKKLHLPLIPKGTVKIALSVLIMVTILLPLRTYYGIVELFFQIVIGAFVYAASLVVFDVYKTRSILKKYFPIK